MITVSFIHKSSLFFLNLSISRMDLVNNESWQVAFKSAESKEAVLFVSSQRRQVEILFSLGLNVESFLQKHATRKSSILKRNLCLMYLGKLGRIFKCLFFFSLCEAALWQLIWWGHSGGCKDNLQLKTASEQLCPLEEEILLYNTRTSSTVLWPFHFYFSKHEETRGKGPLGSSSPILC